MVDFVALAVRLDQTYKNPRFYNLKYVLCFSHQKYMVMILLFSAMTIFYLVLSFLLEEEET